MGCMSTIVAYPMTSFILSIHLLAFLMIYFIFNFAPMYKSVCGYVQVSAVPLEARRCCWTPWSWYYRRM